MEILPNVGSTLDNLKDRIDGLVQPYILMQLHTFLEIDLFLKIYGL